MIGVLALRTGVQTGDWLLSDTASGALLMTYIDDVRVAITSDGHMWSKATGVESTLIELTAHAFLE